MYRPGVADPASDSVRHWEGRLLNAMGQLKDHTQNKSLDEARCHIGCQHEPGRMPKHRQQQRQHEEYDLATHEAGQVPTTRSRYWVSPVFANCDVAEVVIQLPFDRHKAVQNPQVTMLESVKTKTLGVW